MAYYVTTPIYYVNAAPHLGHAYTTIGADILARHMRQRGEEVFFLTGTDEHGEPVAQAAEKLGVTPKELADTNAERFIALGPRLNVTNDFFIRTSDPRHKRAVQDVMQRIHDNGFTYKGTYEGLYCPRCADFKSEQEIGPDQTCPIHKIPLEPKSEENWFFQLSAFQERLEALYAERPDFVAPGSRYNEALSFIKGGLNDISLSRSKLTWGVEVPWDEGHVFYVWFDALLNYYTALSFAREGEDLTDTFWPAFHIIGKDILKFHAVFWPAMLMAADIELPREIFIHGFLLMKDESGAEHKMSQVARERAGPVRGHRPLRHRRAPLLLLPRGLLRAGRRRLRDRVRRALHERAGQRLRQPRQPHDQHGRALLRRRGADRGPRPGARRRLRGAAAKTVSGLLDKAEITQALEQIWMRVRRLNRYVEETAPWKLAKDETKADELHQALRSLAEGLRVVTVLLVPYIPESTEKLLAALGTPDTALAALGTARIPAGSRSRRSPRCSRSRNDRQPHPPACRPRGRGRVGARPRGRSGSRASSRSARTRSRARRRWRRPRRTTDVFCAVGLHPNYTTDYAGIEWLREYAQHPNVRAIGETGLDDFRDYAPRADQERAFADQIALAREVGKPLVIHTRAAEDDTISTLARDAAGLEVILHCFSMPDRLEECLDHGWWISFAGNVTYPKAADLADAAERVPLDRMLVETDAPYLTPQVVRKERNRPAYVAHTARFIAERRGIAYAELDAAVEANAAKLFGW